MKPTGPGAGCLPARPRQRYTPMPTKLCLLALAVTAGIALTGCKIEPTPSEAETQAADTFDPEGMVADIWAAKVIPYLEEKAGPFAEVQTMAKSDPAAAGAQFGNPNKQTSAPWTYAVRLNGEIVAANTESRAATIDVDVDADGQADARVQIGPAMRGTALRDGLDFVNFNDFTNQIDFAKFGKAFNTHVNRTVLATLPREDLVGRTARILGAYTASSGAELPLVAPAQAEIGSAP